MNINKTKNVVIILIAFLVGAIAMYGVIRKYPIVLTETTTKLEKDVTVTDEGIADAVEKVYDSVVVVKAYNNNKINSGTGFVYKKENGIAYILTNNHVVESSKEIKVVFTNGKEEVVELVDSDEYADIAVLSIDEEKIVSVAEIGDSSKLRVGDTTFTVGAPLDSAYSWSVTRGIISGKDRLVEVSLKEGTSSTDYVMSVLQTDAAINSGNSGGPLCNSNGEVIGINSLKLVSDGIEGMGFAIPIETAVEYAERFISGEEIAVPYLGVSPVNVTEAYYYRDLYNYVASSNLDNGVLLATVEDNSAAAKSGLKAGDIVVGINDYEVTNVAYFTYYLRMFKVGDKITVKFYRDGKLKDVKVTLDKKPN